MCFWKKREARNKTCGCRMWLYFRSTTASLKVWTKVCRGGNTPDLHKVASSSTLCKCAETNATPRLSKRNADLPECFSRRPALTVNEKHQNHGSCGSPPSDYSIVRYQIWAYLTWTWQIKKRTWHFLRVWCWFSPKVCPAHRGPAGCLQAWYHI